MSKSILGRLWDLSLVLVALSSASLALASAVAHSSPSRPDDAEHQAAVLVARLTAEEKVAQLVNVAPAISRLGIPAYNWWTESLHGALGPVATTNFPEPIALAATFDAPMLHEIGGAIAAELRALHALARGTGRMTAFGSGLDTWSPNINIFRDPRWGRGQETYGEDPYLTARMGIAYITGIQGPDPSRPTIVATPKHFAVHSGPESTRHGADVRVTPHDLEDTYLPAFRAAIVEAHAGSIMCAYNRVNGQPACASDLLLKERLARDWGFKGYIVSDCGALLDIAQGHHYAPDVASAVALALKAGVANECSILPMFDVEGFTQPYQEAIQRGLLSPADIDAALVRLFAARYRNGDLPGLAGAQADPHDQSQLLSPAHQDLALRSAEESMVLLKNDGVLPLKPGSRLLVVGPLADGTRVLRGNYSSPLTGTPYSVLSGLRQILPASHMTYLAPPPSITDGDPVPSSALRTPDGKPGLLAEYFNSREALPARFKSMEEARRQTLSLAFEAAPVVSRVEPGVGARGQTLAQLRKYFHVVWTGFLVPPETGTYRLSISGANGSLIFDGKPLASLDKAPWGSLPTFTTLHLEAGARYPIRVESTESSFFDIQLLWKRVADPGQDDLVTAAATVDAVLAVVGLTSDLEGEESPVDLPGFAGGDRTSLDLPSDQQRLLEVARATGKPLIVVVMNGSAINLSWAKEHAAAILEAWYPGQAGGLAVAKILSGETNPSGRLPITFYKDVSELPAFADYSMQNRTYRYYAGEPVFPFGFGLSYTRFEYKNLKLVNRGDPGNISIEVSVQIRNAGQRPGADVSQLYLTFPPMPGAPHIALRGYQQVSLLPGRSKQIHFSLSPRDLSSVDMDGVRRVAQGPYSIFVGSGQPGSAAEADSRATISVPASVPLPR